MTSKCDLFVNLLIVSFLCLWNSHQCLDIVEKNLTGNWCPEPDNTIYELACFSCQSYKDKECLSGETKVANSSTNCTVYLPLLDMTFMLPGCTFSCEAKDNIPQCCTGFWGTDCRACPGGAVDPCGGRGVCSDLIDGTGICKCKAGITGYACELCEDDNVYGPDCSQTCQCDHGNCSGNGIDGDGSCDCFSGYEGQFCDQEIVSCKTLQCQANAKCIEGEDNNPVCECVTGYTANGSTCQEINMCESPSQQCHQNATCVHTGVLAYNCSCFDGFLGDGFYCDPIDPCQSDSGGCDVDTSECVYLAPNKSRCDCLDGFTADPQYGGCMIKDLCPSQGHKCHKHANCSTNSPGLISCECWQGYVGDGFTCYGNILERLYDLNDNDRKLKSQLFSAIRLVEFAYKDILETGGPFTMFIPTDLAFTLSGRGTWLSDLFIRDDLARSILLSHMIAKPLLVEELTNQTAFYTLDGKPAYLSYQQNILLYQRLSDLTKAVVMESDIIASNGILHVVDKVLCKKPKNWSNGPKQSIWKTIQREFSSQINRVLEVLLRKKKTGIDYKGLTETGDSDAVTIFFPSDSAFKSLREGTIDHLIAPKQKDKLALVLYNHVVKGKILNITDLVNMKRFVTLSNNGIKVSITDVGQVQLGRNTSITMSQVESINGVIHVIDSFLIPDSIGTLLPRFCPKQITKEVKGKCGKCRSTRCARMTDIPSKKKDESCSIALPFPGRFRPYEGYNDDFHFDPFRRHFEMFDDLLLGHRRKSGCRKICNRIESNTKQCCSSFYGNECYPCQGGHENACYGRGKCLDGISGNGSCVCDPQFTGAGCEVCVDPNKYGPYCNQTCKCLHGVCDNTVDAVLGFCKSCHQGYGGVYCQLTTQECSPYQRCHVYAECVKRRRDKRKMRRRSRLYCRCKQGYTGSGTHCEEIDPCQTGALDCHVDATCKKTGPGVGECQCNEGWVGDGLYCFPSTVCQTAEHCDLNGRCVTFRPGQSHCECNENYHGNGTVCRPVDVCLENFIGCDQHAVCNSTGPGEGTCTCDSGLAGDGFTCFGDIAFQLQYASDLQEVYKLTMMIEPDDRYLSDLSTNFTLFAPNSSAVVDLLQQEDSAWTSAERNLILLLRYHTLPVALQLEDLQGMNGERLFPLVEDFYINVTTTPQGDVYVNDAKILKADLPALNGYIHIVDKILEPYPPPELLPSLGQVLQQTPSFSLFYYLLKRYDWLRSDGLLSDAISQDMYKYTVFVPVNSAWQGQEALNVTSSRYLKAFFVVNLRLTKSDLLSLDGQNLTTYLGSGTEQSVTLTVIDNNTLLVNGVELILSDQKTYAGYVHGIKSLLQPVLNVCPEKNDPNKCCPGYYGENCEECPGGPSNPCSGRGQCQSNGVCQCEGPYSGTACDLCQNNLCKSVNHCVIANGGCHPFADCDLRNNLVTCHCVEGYIGDGYQCVSPCQIERGGCHDNATCELEYKKPSCRCRNGFSGDGKQCTADLGPCDFRNGGCSVHAHCTSIPNQSGIAEEQSVRCTCDQGYTGDGIACLTNTWQTLKDVAEEDPFVKHFVQMLKKPENLGAKRLMENEDKNVTVFAPVSGNLSVVSGASYVSDSLILLDNSQSSDRVVACVDGSSLYITVDYNASETDELEFRVNEVRVVLKNLLATNGVVHLIESVYTVHRHTEAEQSLTSPNKTGRFTKIHHFSVWGGLGVVIVIAMVILVSVLLWKKRNSISLAFNRMRSGDGFQFQHLKEEESSATTVSFHSAKTSTEDMVDELPFSQN